MGVHSYVIPDAKYSIQPIDRLNVGFVITIGQNKVSLVIWPLHVIGIRQKAGD